MTSSILSSTSTGALGVLLTASQDAAALAQNTQLAEISQDLENQLNQKLAALQEPTDQVSINYSQSQITALQKQQSAVSTAETVFGNNGSILSDMTSQLNTMAQAAGNGDGAGFDTAFSALNTDLADLAVPANNPLFQPDGVAALKTSGFNIQSSASYNLGTPAGQAAATADVTTAQNLMQNILKINGGNQTVAASQGTALNAQITALQTLQTQQQSAQSDQVATETAQLQQNMQNQLHLIQLNLGKTSQVSNMLNSIINPPQPPTSVFAALQNAVGETASTAETQLGQIPAILSLLA
ncbi:MAG TPA: hypothetical protein VGL83_08405 [Stellaceae bacterium]